MQPEVAASRQEERGPRTSAPEQAVNGFLRKHGASRDQLRQADGYWLLEKVTETVSAQSMIAGALPALRASRVAPALQLKTL